MAIDLLRLFDTYGVGYVLSGPNVARGHCAIRCPWCGESDPSQHMSVSLEGRGWRCYRNHDHRGKSAARLLAAAAKMPLDAAKRIVGETTFVPENFMDAVMAQLEPPSKHSDHNLTLPKEFKPIRLLPSARPYINYLEDRGFPRATILSLTQRFNIRYATQGDYHGRIIFPVKCEGRLVSWVGRTISQRVELRYKALGTDEDDDPRALGPLPDYLLWFDDLMECDADTIILCEGPFDALKVMTLGWRLGIVATCFFTSAPSASQIELAHELLPRFKHRALMLDRGTLPLALKVAGSMSSLGVRAIEPPCKDPGELSAPLLERILPQIQR